MKLRNFSFLWNFWPPFLGLGISIKEISSDFKKTVVVLKKRPWNVNYFGSQYGGGIFAMTDGVHMLMLIKNLPKNVRVWDKAAQIEYLKRGYTHLTAECSLTDSEIDGIKEQLQNSSELDWSVTINIKDASQQVVARVVRTLSIKQKPIESEAKTHSGSSL